LALGRGAGSNNSAMVPLQCKQGSVESAIHKVQLVVMQQPEGKKEIVHSTIMMATAGAKALMLSNTGHGKYIAI